jgi:hypothetical protein
MLNMEMIVSILSIWTELTGFTETMIYELCYRFYAGIKNRSAILYLLGTLMTMTAANDKAIFHEALKTLTSPYNPKKYERKSDSKDKEPGAPKERKPLPLLKYHHHDEFFGDFLGNEQPLLEFMFHSLFEPKSATLDIALDKFLPSLFQ